MKSLKHKASQFFKDGLSQDEKAAIAGTAGDGKDFDFDAGIQHHTVKNKASRFFQRKQNKLDKPLASPLHNNASASVFSGQVASRDHPPVKYSAEDEIKGTEKRIPFPAAPIDLVKSPKSTNGTENNQPLLALPAADMPKTKLRPSLTALKFKSSRFFRNSDYGSHSPPRPLSPQISVSPTEADPPLPVPTPRPTIYSPRSSTTTSSGHTIHSPRSSITTSNGRIISISRPMLVSQSQVSPVPKHPVTVPFTKPTGVPPPRPPRPDSIDEETLAFMREASTRMVLPANHRISASTASASTPRSGISSVNSRLGLPDGYGTPRKNTLDSPLAVQFPWNPLKPLPVRDSNGSVKYSRFSEYVKMQKDGYADDGVDAADRDIGPIEQYDKDKEGDWVLVKRVSKGPGDQPGMLFRDRLNGFHFVADI
ncbi:hypothetical protein J1614_005208 [Plenodomus biglobosus]|nr:hypothetical protein J1614_005208 [Plenodomus biglobosus]